MAPAAATPPPAAAGELFKDNKRNAAFIRAFLGLPAAPEAVRIFDRKEYYTVRFGALAAWRISQGRGRRARGIPEWPCGRWVAPDEVAVQKQVPRRCQGVRVRLARCARF